MKILWVLLTIVLSVIIVVISRIMMKKPTILIEKWKRRAVVIGTIVSILIVLVTIDTIEGKVMKFPTPEEAVFYTHSVVMPADGVYMIDHVLDGRDTTAVFFRTNKGDKTSDILRKENEKWRIDNQFNIKTEVYLSKENDELSTISLNAYKGTKDYYLVINEAIDSLGSEIYDISDNLNTEFVTVTVYNEKRKRYSNKYYAYLYDLDRENYVVTINGEEVKFKDLYRLS